MIQDVGLRWLVTLLFVFSAAVCVRGLVASRHSPASLISHSLHALMAIAMAVMAWPRGADLPARAPMIFFALAAVWFVAITITGRMHRGANGYHALMMMAMAWMYAAMGGLPLPKASPEIVARAVMDVADAVIPRKAGRAWAQRIIDRHQAGEAVSVAALQMAQRALEAKAEEVTA